MARILMTLRLFEHVRAALWARARWGWARQRGGRDPAEWLDGLRARAIARTRGRTQTDSVDLIAEGRESR